MQISDYIGRSSGDEYFSRFVHAICKHLELACGCVYSIDDEFAEQWKLVTSTRGHDSCCKLNPLLESKLKYEILNNKQTVIIDLLSSGYLGEEENTLGLTCLLSFFLYNSDNHINGVVIFGADATVLDQNTVIEVIDSQVPRAESVLDNMQNIIKLNAYENNYNKLVDSSPDVIWEADTQGRITAISSSCKAIYGFSEDFMLGKEYTDFMTEKSASQFIEYLELMSRSECFYNVLSDHIGKDHEHIMVSYNIIPKLDENHKISGVIGATRDISKSIKAQETIKNTSELFSSILSRLPVIFFRLDANGQFVEIRGNGLRRMGVEDMDWVDKPAYGLFVGMDAEIDSALAGNTVFFENKGTYTGTPWWFYTSMFFDSWSGDGAVGFSVDITEQKYVEEQLVELLNNNRKLAQHLVEVQEDERRTLARELHDELGQSITAVKSLATVICASTGNQYTEIRSLGNSIIDLSGQLYEVVNNIMQRLRPDIIDNLDFSETLGNCIVRSQLETAGVNCNLDIVGNVNGLQEVVKVSIYRIVQECLTNISKHAMASNVTVHVRRGVEESNLRRSKVYDALQRNSARTSAINRDTIKIEITDDGIGMDVHHKIRNGKTAKRHGLQGIHERVTAMGGTLTITSDPGKGSTILAILVLGGNKHDVSRDINKCIKDLRKMRVERQGAGIINSRQGCRS